MIEKEKRQVASPLLVAFAPIQPVAMGVAVGVVLGGIIFLMTVVLLVKGGDPAGPALALLGQYFAGYTVTWAGAGIGLLWGFGVGFVLGWSFALLRNFLMWSWLSFLRLRAEIEHSGDFQDPV